MSVYAPPNNLNPIFNPGEFSHIIEDGLTIDDADARYLRLVGGVETEEVVFQQGLRTNQIDPLASGNNLTFSTTGVASFGGNVNIPSGSNYLVNNVPLVASQTGQVGKFLTTDGTQTSWQNSSASPGGSNTQIQYNNNGSFAGTNQLTYNSGTNLFTCSASSLFSGPFQTSFSTTLFGPVTIGGADYAVPSQQRGGTVSMWRGSFTGALAFPLPVNNASGFLCISVWNNSGNWASATGVCRPGAQIPQLQQSGTNPVISGLSSTVGGQPTNLISFTGSATNSTCYYSIWLLSDGFFG